MLIRVLILMGRKSLRARLAEGLESSDVHVSHEKPTPLLWGRLAREDYYHLVVAEEECLPAEPGPLFDVLRTSPVGTEVVVVVDDDDAERRATLLETGALAVVPRFASRPGFDRRLSALIRRRAQSEAALAATDGARWGEPVPSLGDFVSQSLAMNELLDLASRVVASDTSLLILGETGVGKEWLARAIHTESPRASGPFVAVNCAAVPEGLLESELFGHVEGAFTGALRTRRGQFELAHGGTLFLDEIFDTPPALQAKLLRALQEHAVQPLGSEELLYLDVRIMAATNRDLERAVADGEFRSDLFYRIGVVNLPVPPLRERRDDIAALVDTHRERFSMQLGRRVDAVSDEALEALVAYDWPGNVRELINVIERGVLLCSGSVLDVGDLPPSVTGPARSRRAARRREEIADRVMNLPLSEARAEIVEDFERAYLARVLERCDGRVGEAASRAEVDPRTLYNKMRQYGLSKEAFRD
jgi:transcriptional regulator with GAF, ATPase, and Fis domain